MELTKHNERIRCKYQCYMIYARFKIKFYSNIRSNYKLLCIPIIWINLYLKFNKKFCRLNQFKQFLSTKLGGRSQVYNLIMF